MKIFFFILTLFSNAIVIAQEFDYSIFLKAQGIYGSNDESPFWFYSNQNGQLDGETNFLGLASFETYFKKTRILILKQV